MIIINDNDVCSICGAYFQGDGYCVNGHLRLKKEIENNCLTCSYLEKSYDKGMGTCKCVASKFYGDTMDKDGSCDRHEKNV